MESLPTERKSSTGGNRDSSVYNDALAVKVNTYTYGGLLIALTVLLFVVFLPPTVEAHEIAETVVIHMTEDGFVPEEIFIEAGTTVVFENNGSRPRWPATNIHPTHTVYPGSDILLCGSEEESLFDSCRSLQEGEGFSFVFTEPGKWRYHDHLVPTEGGIVFVSGERNTTPKRLLGLYSFRTDILRSGLRLYGILFPSVVERRLASVSIFTIAENTKQLEELVFLAGPARVMDKLLVESETDTLADCHQEAHQIGRVSFNVFGASVFSEADASCHSGYYHGAMEAFLSSEGTERLAENIREICARLTTSFEQFGCMHGLGHGVLAAEDYELETSLSVCGALPTMFEKQSCYGGVFMENIITAQGLGAVPGHETEWVSTDPYFPCNILSEDAIGQRYECYQMQTSWMLTLFDFDFAKVADACLSAPEDMRATCFRSLGRDAAGVMQREVHPTLRLCELAPREDLYRASCIGGALDVVVGFWGPELGSQGQTFCSEVTGEEEQRICFSLLEQRLEQIFGRLSS